jgi:hypothetical protein
MDQPVHDQVRTGIYTNSITEREFSLMTSEAMN